MPVPLATAVERWFRRHQRPLPWRRTYDPYHVWVSEVMAQQTRLEVVIAYFEKFIARFPTTDALASASIDQVTAAWSGLGYYRRARMLRDGAIDVQQRFGGALPHRVDELLTIAGIGRYTAGAISSIAFNEHAPIVDGNIARITARLFGIREAVASPALMRASWTRAEEMVESAKTPRVFNQGLMEIGALICTPRKPQCDRCPLTEHCLAFRTNQTDSLPLARVKEATRELRIPLYVVVDRKGRVLMQRTSGRLMNAMFHLPHGNTSLIEGAALAVDGARLVGSFRHTVTNRRITFEVHCCHPERSEGTGRKVGAPPAAQVPRYAPDDKAWIYPAELATVPHPSYVRKALQLAGMTGATPPVPKSK